MNYFKKGYHQASQEIKKMGTIPPCCWHPYAFWLGYNLVSIKERLTRYILSRCPECGGKDLVDHGYSDYQRCKNCGKII